MGLSARAHQVALLQSGARLGRYFLLQQLAIGGMAELHLACAEGVGGFQKVVVLKRVLPHLARDRDFIALFLNEARLAANLDHPNLVQVMDIGQEGDEYFYAMEYVHGHNVRELLAEASKRGAMPLEVALTIIMAVATGLHHAHDRVDLDGQALGLVHRDVSPANVLVSYDGAVKVTDFGIAKASARSTETIGGAMKGKIGYMSPEQCRGEPVDRRSDIFAVGILLFELTTTERLFYADNDFAVLNKIMKGRFEPPSQRVEGYPPALEAIVLRALAPRPDDRYATAGELLRALESFAHEAHLRCGTATLADWMTEVFGRRPYPRVELLPARAEDPLDLIPTLISAGESAAGADPGAITRSVEPTDPIEPAPPRRSRTPMLLGVLGVSAALGLGIAWWWPQSEPARLDVQQRAPSGAPTAAAAPPPTASPAAAPQPDQAVTDRTQADPPGQTDDEGRSADEAIDSGVPEPPRRSKPKRTRKRKPKRKTKPISKGSAKEPGDIDALYPVKG